MVQEVDGFSDIDTKLNTILEVSVNNADVEYFGLGEVNSEGVSTLLGRGLSLLDIKINDEALLSKILKSPSKRVAIIDERWSSVLFADR